MLVMKVVIVLEKSTFFALLALLRLLTGVLLSHWWHPPLIIYSKWFLYNKSTKPHLRCHLLVFVEAVLADEVGTTDLRPPVPGTPGTDLLITVITVCAYSTYWTLQHLLSFAVEGGLLPAGLLPAGVQEGGGRETH